MNWKIKKGKNEKNRSNKNKVFVKWNRPNNQ